MDGENHGKSYFLMDDLGGKPKWMVYNGKSYFLMDDLGGKPIIFVETSIYRLGPLFPPEPPSWDRQLPG